MTSMDTLCYLILKQKLQTALISIPDPFDNTQIINLSILQFKKPDISVKLVNGSPYISVKAYLKATIVSLASNSDFSVKENLNVISEYANSYIASHISEFLYKTSTNYNSDVVGFGKYLMPNYRTLTDWYNIEWPANYKNSFFEVSADVNIVTSNLILKN